MFTLATPPSSPCPAGTGSASARAVQAGPGWSFQCFQRFQPPRTGCARRGMEPIGCCAALPVPLPPLVCKSSAATPPRGFVSPLNDGCHGKSDGENNPKFSTSLRRRDSGTSPQTQDVFEQMPRAKARFSNRNDTDSDSTRCLASLMWDHVRFFRYLRLMMTLIVIYCPVPRAACVIFRSGRVQSQHLSGVASVYLL